MGILATVRRRSLRICNPFQDSRSFQGHLEVKSSKLYSSNVMGIIATLRWHSLRICNWFPDWRLLEVIWRSNLQLCTRRKWFISLESSRDVLYGSVSSIRIGGYWRSTRGQTFNITKNEVMYIIGKQKECTLRICITFQDWSSFEVVLRSNLQH